MRKLLFLVLVFALSIRLNADESEMLFDDEHIYTFSHFNDVVYFTAYDYFGYPAWEIPFQSKILNSKIKEGYVYIFSRSRNNKICYLTCIDIKEGKVIWEKPIFAPNLDEDDM